MSAVPHDRVSVSEPRQRGDRGSWRVEVRIAGRGKVRTFHSLTEARRYRDRLAAAKREGEPFDQASGEPVAWAALAGTRGVTVLEAADHLCARLMRDLAPGGRKSKVQRIAWAVLGLGPVPAGVEAPDAYRVLVLRLRGETLTGEDLNTSRRLADVSPTMASVSTDRCRTALAAFATNADGTEAGPVTVRNRRQGLAHLLGDAVRRGLLTANPMPPTERAGRSTADRESVKVSPRRIGTAAQVHAVLAAVGTEPAWRAHAAAALRTIYATGCRPGEVLALTGPDVQGSVVYFGASRTQPGSAWSDGETTHTGPLKHRARNAVRAVPVADAAVAAELTERAVKGGRLFPVSEGQLSQAWREARAAVADGTWPAERLARVYDLRHQHASLGLNAGVSPVEMGRRLGHSPEVCLTVYADVISTDADRWTAVLAAALA